MATSYTFTFHYVNGSQCIVIGALLPAICIVIVALRFYTRILQRVNIGKDDWLIVGGLLAVIGMGACMIDGAKAGVFGYPTPPSPANLSDSELLSYLDPTTLLEEKIEFPFQILMVTAYGLIKLSIIFFYRRLFIPKRRGAFDIISAITAVAVLLWTIAFILMIIFPCGRHIAANWGSEEDYLTLCPIVFTSEYGLVISDLILDVFVITLPVPIIWRLHLSAKKKVAVTGIIMLGASAIGASITRLVLYVQELNGLSAAVALDTNQTITLGFWWSLLEAGLALIAACLPTLSYLFTHFLTEPKLHRLRSAFSLRSTSSARPLPRGSHETISYEHATRVYTKTSVSGSVALQEKGFRKSSLSSDEDSNRMLPLPQAHLTHEVV